MLNITRRYPSTDLDDLLISGNPINFNFNKKTYNYEKITFVSNVPSFTITPKRNSTITIDGTLITTTNPSKTYTLREGEIKTIKIVSRASGLHDKTYTLQIGRSLNFYDRGVGQSPRYVEITPFPIGESQWSNIKNAELGTVMTIDKGENNTNMIVSQTGHTFSAAQMCLDFGNDTDYDNWYLPSFNTLMHVHSNFSNYFIPEIVWSSSEGTQGNYPAATTAHALYSKKINQYVVYKNATHPVYAVRAFD